jgi:hypothetical protein
MAFEDKGDPARLQSRRILYTDVRIKLVVLKVYVRRRGPKMLTALIEELDRTLDHTFTSVFSYNHMLSSVKVPQAHSKLDLLTATRLAYGPHGSHGFLRSL